MAHGRCLTAAGPVGGRAAMDVVRDDGERPPQVSREPLGGQARNRRFVTGREERECVRGKQWFHREEAKVLRY